MLERQESGKSVADEAIGAFSDAYLLEILSRVSTASLPSASAVRAGLEAAFPHLAPSREVLADAAHRHFCLIPGEATHEPDDIDFDKADEILEILALINQPTKQGEPS